MSFQQGDIVGQYKIIRTIGVGGMATVYLAEQEKLDRQVALKFMHDSFKQDESFTLRFEREAKIVASLDHPHIIPVYDYSEHAGQPYLVMKYVEGKSLKRVFNEKQFLSLDSVLDLLTPIADALTFAHNKGILHRDVKPSNIMIDNAEVPFLADFGLARIALAGESTLSQDAILGTPAYISPEQANGAKDIDGRADNYSLGIVLYQLLVGEVPFKADTPIAVIHDHIYRPLPQPSAINPDITPNVEKVLVKALAKSPDERYQTANGMIAALKKAAKADNFNQLTPEHIERAGESIAIYREKEFTGAVPATTIAGTPTETIVDSASLKTEYRYRFVWAWVIGGLLLFTIMSCGTIVTLGSAGAAAEEIYYELRVTAAVLEREQYIETIPRLSLNEARQAAEEGQDGIAFYLGAAQILLANDRIPMAQRILERGYEETASPIDYLLVTGDFLALNEQYTLALGFYLRALDEQTQIDADERRLIRSQAFAAAYEIVSDAGKFSQNDLETLTDVMSLDRESYQAIILARALITHKEFTPLESQIEEVNSINNQIAAEAYLMLGDYYLARNDPDNAEGAWQDALDQNNVSVWVRAAAEERLSTIKGD